MKDDSELKQLAADIFGGQVFTDRSVPEAQISMIGNIFMPLALMNEEQMAELMAKEPAMIYEHMSKAGQYGVNGFPTFHSLQYIGEDELEKVQGYLNRLQSALEDEPSGGLGREGSEECAFGK